MNARRSSGLLCALATVTVGVLFCPPPLTGAAGAGAQPAAASQTQRLVLAMVRNDGILLPFAAYNGRKWSAPWPFLDRANIELPVNLESVPRDWWGGEAPVGWQLWTRNAETPRPLSLSSVVMMQIGRSRQVGFRTDQPPVLPPVPPFEVPFPKMGVAIAGEARLAPIATVSALSPVFKTFAAGLREGVDEAEETTIGAIRAYDSWRHPFPREVRAKTPIELEAWYVTPVGPGGDRMSYIEAAKKYPVRPEDEGCGLETFVSGWVHHDEPRTAKVKGKLKAVVTYCDRRGVSYMLPFGQLQVGGLVYWVVQMSGRDHEWYVVVEGAPGRVKYVAEYQAGWAPLNR